MAVAMMIASTALQTISALREGQQQSDAEKYNASVAEAQAGAVRTSAAFQSGTLSEQSRLRQEQISRAKARTTSTQRATYAKSGVRIDEGSPLEVQADTAGQYEIDLAAERYNLASGLEAIRYESETQQAQLNMEAEYRRKLAKAYKTASYLKAGTTFLTGMYGAGSAGGLFRGTAAVPGQDGYGLNTPPGTRNMGNYSTWRRA